MAKNPESLANLRPGNKRGPSKTTKLLKDAILQAAEEAGGAEGMVGYLKVQAIENPGPFMTLLGKVMPTQITGADGGAVLFKNVSEMTDNELLAIATGSSAGIAAASKGTRQPH